MPFCWWVYLPTIYLLWQRSLHWQNQTFTESITSANSFIDCFVSFSCIPFFCCYLTDAYRCWYSFNIIADSMLMFMVAPHKWWCWASNNIRLARMEMRVWLKQTVDNTKRLCIDGAQCLNEKRGTRVIAAQYQSGQQQYKICVNVQDYVTAAATAVSIQHRSAISLIYTLLLLQSVASSPLWQWALVLWVLPVTCV